MEAADKDIETWQKAFAKRASLYSNNHTDCFRLLHLEDQDVRMDRFGDQFWIYDYSMSEAKRTKLLDFCAEQNLDRGFVRKMVNRGQSVEGSDLLNVGKAQDEWTALENSLHFSFKSNQGLSPGLFLDQRQNRQWVAENINDGEVLNLFAYTGGFSVAAARGGAKQVTTVDLNQNFINWSKANFTLNQLDVNAHEFWVNDALLFLKGCKKRDRKFDLIICDPPSFSRAKDKVFRIETDFEELLDLNLSVLKPDGKLIFCTNYEKWNRDKLLKTAKLICTPKRIQAQILAQTAVDFEEFGQEPLMKSLLFSK